LALRFSSEEQTDQFELFRVQIITVIAINQPANLHLPSGFSRFLVSLFLPADSPIDAHGAPVAKIGNFLFPTSKHCVDTSSSQQ
jgi:hypothetical protein